MKRFLALLSAMLLLFALSIQAQTKPTRFENAYCYYENTDDAFVSFQRCLSPSVHNNAMYLARRDHILPHMGMNQASDVPGQEASVIFYVLPGKRLDVLRAMERQFIGKIWRDWRVTCGEIEEGRKKGGGELFLLPMGSADMILKSGEPEKVHFMGVDDAVRTDYMVDLGQSPMFLSLMNSNALQVRMRIFRWYDPTAEKSTMAIFVQVGFDREYVPDNELLAVAAALGGLSTMLIQGNPANSQQLKDWINHSTWKDAQPDFERNFHLKPAIHDTNDTLPPITLIDDTTIVIGKGGERSQTFDVTLQPAPPVLGVLPEPVDPSPLPRDPTDPGQHIAFYDLSSSMGGGLVLAENDTATYLIGTAEGMNGSYISINKQTGQMYVDTLGVVTRKYNIEGAGCLSNGRLLIYKNNVGVIDVFSQTVLLADESYAPQEGMVVDPKNDYVYVWQGQQLSRYNAQMKLLNTWSFQELEKSVRSLHVDPEGRAWVSVGTAYYTDAIVTILGNQMSSPLVLESGKSVTIACPLSKGKMLGLSGKGLYEVSATALPVQLVEATDWRVCYGAVMNSRGDIFVSHDSRYLDRYTSKGGFAFAEHIPYDFRFGKKGYNFFETLYIDRMDNIWYNTGKIIYVWNPTGKLNGYGNFNGIIRIGNM